MRATVCGCSEWMNLASCCGSAFWRASKLAASVPMVFINRSSRPRACSGPKALTRILRA
jgi:hypothetical protein